MKPVKKEAVEVIDVDVDLGTAAVLPSAPVALQALPLRRFAAGLAAVAVAVAWLVVVRTQLNQGAREQALASVSRAQALFQQSRKNTQLRLNTECQLMSEDPRLKSTLATAGIDRTTIQDVLSDLRKLSSADFIAVLTTSGQVRAVTGFEALSGRDLSSSVLLKREAKQGSWMMGERLVDVSVRPLRFGDQELIGFLLVGAQVTEASFQEVTSATGASVALLAGGQVVLATGADGNLKQAFAGLASNPGAMDRHLVSYGGASYAAAISEAGEGSLHGYVTFLYSPSAVLEPFGSLFGLTWVPALAALLLGLLSVGWNRTPA